MKKRYVNVKHTMSLTSAPTVNAQMYQGEFLKKIAGANSEL